MQSHPHDTLVIPAWANGPDGSGNGGWTAGLLARHVPGGERGVAVDLRVPPPLDRPLAVAAGDAAGEVQLLDGDVLVARGRPEIVDVAVPPEVAAVDVATAREASAGFPFRDRHPFPRCIACGTRREAGAPALLLHCGPVVGASVRDDAGEPVPVFADVWEPGADVADPGSPGVASVEACWSALDCPSATPFADPDAEHASVLARFAVRLDREVPIGGTYVLAAWARAVDGRKQWSSSALLDTDGHVLGLAHALWIQVRPR